MHESRDAAREITDLEARAREAMQSGRVADGTQHWKRITELDPRHAPAWKALGQQAYRGGDMAGARASFARLVEADGRDPQHWVSLALACKGLKDEAGERDAIQSALNADPSDLLALIMRANFLQRQGDTHGAARAYGAVVAVSPPVEQLLPDLRSSVAYAASYRDEYDRNWGAFMDRFLEPHYAKVDGEDVRRFRQSIDLMVGRRKRFEARPTHFFFPGLEPVEFFERNEFPWLDAFEAASDTVRDEFRAVWEAQEGISPYIAYPPGLPLNQWAELNNSQNWSAFQLFDKGKPIAANVAKCPATMALLNGAPQPDQPGRTPAAMFSILKPRTRIPPHTGVSNARLVVHLPLIIPEGCGFRVGNETRTWVSGKAWVFDDTIAHEAWNDSEQLRVVFIFDIWHPRLSAAERSLITAMAAAMDEFAAGSIDFGL